MKNYNFKISRILTIALTSAAMMGVTTALDNVSTVRADEVSDSAVKNFNDQAQTNDNIVTGTWGTAPWTWDKTTGEITVGAGTLSAVNDAPWKQITWNTRETIRKIIFTGKVVLPTNSSGLFDFGLSDSALNSIDGLKNLDTSNVTDISYMFTGNNNIKNLDLSNFDTSKVTNMNAMFYGDYSLTSLNVSNFDTSKVTNMNQMFGGLSKIEHLDLSNFNTSNVKDMNRMFIYMYRLKNLDLSNFNTSNVTDMSLMFSCCRGLEHVNLSSFDTSKVTNMVGMFTSNLLGNDGDGNLKELDLSNFDTSKVTNMLAMFDGQASIKKLDISNFDMSNVKYSDRMFKRNNSLNTLILGKKNKFVENTNLPSVPSTDGYLGKWQNTKDSNGNNISNGNIYTSDDLLTNYTPDRAGTYTWAKKSNDVSDLKDLYNKVKLSISYSGPMFNSQPGNSMKYKDEFTNRSMFGAMDYAFNSKDYDGLVKLMHDSIKKTHESIGSLQVNEAKAQELGLNVDQLKVDLARDSVPYDYSQDNDIDGINKQLDSFASVRAKYNKLVQEGVFDKSDYWTMNK